MEDHVGGAHAVVWLTAEELARGPRVPGGHVPIMLRARVDDPGTGHRTGEGAPRASDVEARFARSHFGGSSTSYSTRQNPRYLELEASDVGASYGGGAAQIDLASTPSITWGED